MALVQEPTIVRRKTFASVSLQRRVTSKSSMPRVVEPFFMLTALQPTSKKPLPVLLHGSHYFSVISQYPLPIPLKFPLQPPPLLLPMCTRVREQQQLRITFHILSTTLLSNHNTISIHDPMAAVPSFSNLPTRKCWSLICCGIL